VYRDLVAEEDSHFCLSSRTIRRLPHSGTTVIGPQVTSRVVEHEMELCATVGDLAVSNGGPGHRSDQVGACQHE
jgi:hypothetical protein